jgi:predicted transcriptional regulator
MFSIGKSDRTMTSVPFSFRIDPAIKARLEQEAKIEDRSASNIAQRAIADYLDAKEYKREAIREAIAEADKGVFISEEAMDAWINSWDTEKELPPPEPDIFPEKANA